MRPLSYARWPRNHLVFLCLSGLRALDYLKLHILTTNRYLLSVAILCVSNYFVDEAYWESAIERIFHNMLLRHRDVDVIIAGYWLLCWSLNLVVARASVFVEASLQVNY